MSTLFKQKNNQKGFALLYSVLVAVLVVAVGASVVSLAIKQVVLTGTARESEYAFYAANTGIECARYWDTRPLPSGGGKKAFPGEDETGGIESDYQAMYCGTLSSEDGGDTNMTYSMPIRRSEIESNPSRHYTMPHSWTKGDHVFSFELDNNIPLSSKTCVEVRVKTVTNPELATNSLADKYLVTITSQGMNTCDINSPRAVQRGLVLQYTR